MPLKEGGLSRPRSRLASRQYAALGASTDSLLSRSDTFTRHTNDVTELLDIVKTQASPYKQGTDLRLRRKAPLPGIGEHTARDTTRDIERFDTRIPTGDVMSCHVTPRIVVEPTHSEHSDGYIAMDSGRTAMDSSCSAMDSSRTAIDSSRTAMDSSRTAMDSSRSARLSASCDEFNYLSPRHQLPMSGAAHNTLSRHSLSRSMETFPRHTPRKTYKLRPMAQRRLSSVPEARLSALVASRDFLVGSRLPRDIQESSDVSLCNYIDHIQSKYKRGNHRTQQRERIERPVARVATHVAPVAMDNDIECAYDSQAFVAKSAIRRSGSNCAGARPGRRAHTLERPDAPPLTCIPDAPPLTCTTDAPPYTELHYSDEDTVDYIEL